jgi:hypothetical protein
MGKLKIILYFLVFVCFLQNAIGLHRDDLYYVNDHSTKGHGHINHRSDPTMISDTYGIAGINEGIRILSCDPSTTRGLTREDPIALINYPAETKLDMERNIRFVKSEKIGAWFVAGYKQETNDIYLYRFSVTSSWISFFNGGSSDPDVKISKASGNKIIKLMETECGDIMVLTSNALYCVESNSLKATQKWDMPEEYEDAVGMIFPDSNKEKKVSWQFVGVCITGNNELKVDRIQPINSKDYEYETVHCKNDLNLPDLKNPRIGLSTGTYLYNKKFKPGILVFLTSSGNFYSSSIVTYEFQLSGKNVTKSYHRKEVLHLSSGDLNDAYLLKYVRETTDGEKWGMSFMYYSVYDTSDTLIALQRGLYRLEETDQYSEWQCPSEGGEEGWAGYAKPIGFILGVPPAPFTEIKHGVDVGEFTSYPFRWYTFCGTKDSSKVQITNDHKHSSSVSFNAVNADTCNVKTGYSVGTKFEKGNTNSVEYTNKFYAVDENERFNFNLGWALFLKPSDSKISLYNLKRWDYSSFNDNPQMEYFLAEKDNYFNEEPIVVPFDITKGKAINDNFENLNIMLPKISEDYYPKAETGDSAVDVLKKWIEQNNPVKNKYSDFLFTSANSERPANMANFNWSKSIKSEVTIKNSTDEEKTLSLGVTQSTGGTIPLWFIFSLSLKADYEYMWSRSTSFNTTSQWGMYADPTNMGGIDSYYTSARIYICQLYPNLIGSKEEKFWITDWVEDRGYAPWCITYSVYNSPAAVNI